MRRPTIPGVLLTSVLVLSLLPVYSTAIVAGTTTGNVNFLPGIKAMDEEDWSPIEDQPALGINVSWGKQSWPIQLAVDYLISRDEEDAHQFGGDVTLEGVTAELGFGIQKTWEVGRFRPFIGGGGAAVFAQIKVDAPGIDISENGVAPGAWAGAGFFFRLGPRFNLGLSARYSKAEVTISDLSIFGVPIEDLDVEAGGLHTALVLGWGWPASK